MSRALTRTEIAALTDNELACCLRIAHQRPGERELIMAEQRRRYERAGAGRAEHARG